jgi:hypothetical protein
VVQILRITATPTKAGYLEVSWKSGFKTMNFVKYFVLAALAAATLGVSACWCEKAPPPPPPAPTGKESLSK